MAKPQGANRNYPAMSLEESLEIATAIQNRASGMPVSKLTLADLVERSPSSSALRELIGTSRAFGLTSGGINAVQFELTELGAAATGADEVARDDALRRAVMNVEPFRVFFTAYHGKKVPSAGPLKEFLTGTAGVPAERADEGAARIVRDGEFVGFIRDTRGGKYVDMSASQPIEHGTDEAEQEHTEEDEQHKEQPSDEVGSASVGQSSESSTPSTQTHGPAKKVFIAHGKNRVPLDQLKKILDQFKVKYAVAVDEPHSGRPISAKVASLMRDECSSGIFIFTADEEFFKKDDEGESVSVWRPSENVVYELGAASMLYDRRIVIFKEKAVTFPSDFSDLGYIEFEPDQLASQTGDLFSELVSLDILEVRAKG